jgi:hypothetical protein
LVFGLVRQGLFPFDDQTLIALLVFVNNFFQENENNFGGLRSRLKPSAAGGGHFGERTEMISFFQK